MQNNAKENINLVRNYLANHNTSEGVNKKIEDAQEIDYDQAEILLN